MSRTIFRRMSIGVLVAAGLLVAGVGFCTAPKPMQPVQGSPVLSWTGPIVITPAAPPVGTYYTVTGMLHSRHNRPLLVQATISTPPLDRADQVTITRRIDANSDLGFMWTVYCGESGGTVRVKADIVQEY